MQIEYGYADGNQRDDDQEDRRAAIDGANEDVRGHASTARPFSANIRAWTLLNEQNYEHKYRDLAKHCAGVGFEEFVGDPE